MTEHLVCRACYHVRHMSHDDSPLCAHCHACSWLLVRRTGIKQWSGTVLTASNANVAQKYLLRVFNRIRIVNR